MNKYIRSILLIVITFAVSSCVAVWGSGHKVVYSNSEGMLIQFDPLISGPAKIAEVAQAEATKYGRVIVPGEHEPSHYSGIHQRYFKFIKPSGAGRTEY